MYLSIPISGEIGRDAMAAGLEDAIRWGHQKDIAVYVLVIDSPGGLIEEAEAMVQAMQRYDDVRFVVQIKRALSACVWIVAAADEVVMEPEGTIGAAVAWQVSSGGAPQALEAKALSALAARVAALAESTGKPPELFRAMIEPSAEVWLGRGVEDGELVVADGVRARVETGVEWSIRDSDEAVLTLTAGEAIATGLADQRTPAERLGAMRSAGGYGKGAMLRAQQAEAKRRNQITDDGDRVRRIREWTVEIEKLAGQARQKDPRNFDDYAWEIVSRENIVVRTVSLSWTQYTSYSATQRASMRMTEASRAKWNLRKSDAIRAWRDIVAGIEDIANLDRRLIDRRVVQAQRTRMEIIHDEASETIRRIEQGY